MFWTSPTGWKWQWLTLQVILPLIGPIAVSFVVALLWQTGQPKFQIDTGVIVDITPWAMTFFAVALIGGGFHDIWLALALHRALFIFLLVDAAAVLIYASFIVIWRHQTGWVPPPSVYADIYPFGSLDCDMS